MSKVLVKGRKSIPAKPIAEDGSPYAWYGFGPRIWRLTTWEPERWEQERDPAAAGLPHLSRETKRFHTWQDQGNRSLSLAHYYAKNVARGNLTMGHFLVLAGPSWVGKTHLATAIAWEWFEDGTSVMFSRADDLLDELRRGYRDDTYYELLQKIRQCSLLVLDDLGTEQAKAWAGERIDRIIDWRYNSRLPLVVTTNAKSEDLPDRVASWLADGSCSMVVQIDAEKYRGGE